MNKIISVSVKAYARLHLGFFDLNGDLGRKYGSIGLAINDIYTSILLERERNNNTVHEVNPRAIAVLDKIMQLHDCPAANRPFLSVLEAIPPHVGLGSGTQLTLALAKACAIYFSRDKISDKAAELGRGKRSGSGIELFHNGGLMIDGGRGEATSVPPLLARYDFPPEWPIILVLAPSHQGYAGKEEIAAFNSLPQFSATSAGNICRILVMKVLPALVERDFHNFADGISTIQEIVGDYFAPVQGNSRYLCPAVAVAIEHLRNAGARGVGQSSWGSTGFAMAENFDIAQKIVHSVRPLLSPEVYLRIVSSRNKGAEVRLITEEN